MREAQLRTTARAVPAPTPSARTPAPPAPFVKPRPGAWKLDASHCEQPLPRFMDGVFEAGFSRGFRAAFAAYGALVDDNEAALVNGFVYTCIRPFGAPAEPKGPPPRFVFKLLMWLHPEVRRRLRRSERVFVDKLWREEVRRYREEWAPPLDSAARRAARHRPGGARRRRARRSPRGAPRVRD